MEGVTVWRSRRLFWPRTTRRPTCGAGSAEKRATTLARAASTTEKGQPMMRWEYLVSAPGRGVRLQEWLESHGADGWELVSVNWAEPAADREFVFKRPIHTEGDK